MNYQVLARKWRPQNFDEIVGQQHIVKSLSNALEHNRLHHAYLFTGTRGVGKTTFARILAKALNCEQRETHNPCGQCQSCIDLDEGRFLDLIEVDGASRTKVEDTRELLENAQYAPHIGKYKIYLIDEVHMLSGHSFNALLKTLEEPPEHVKFLLATTDPQKIPITVLSRCLQFNLKRLLPDQMCEQMQHILQQEQVAFDQEALNAIARAADGSMRDALSLLDQAIVHGNGTVAIEAALEMLGTVAQQPVLGLLEALADLNAKVILERVDEIAGLAPDYGDVLAQMLQLLHKLALLKSVPAAFQHDGQVDVLQPLAKRFETEDIQLFYQIALLGQRDLDLAPDPRGGFEMVLLRMLTFRPANSDDSIQGQPLVAKANSQKENTPTTKNISEPAKNEATIENKSSVELSEGSQLPQWSGLVNKLKISSLTRELANNCVLQQLDDKQCVLWLEPGFASIKTARRVETLKKALHDYLGHPVVLTIELKSADEAALTPAQEANRQRVAEQQAAEQAISEDKNILALQENFDARVLPGSIDPIE